MLCWKDFLTDSQMALTVCALRSLNRKEKEGGRSSKDRKGEAGRKERNSIRKTEDKIRERRKQKREEGGVKRRKEEGS